MDQHWLESHKRFRPIEKAVSLQPQTFLIARELAETSLSPPNILLDKKVSLIPYHLIVVRQWLNELIASKGGTDLSIFEKMLIESVLLILSQRLLIEKGCRSILQAYIGAMIQQRLTLILTCVEPEQRPEIWNLSKIQSLPYRVLRENLTGASSVANLLNQLAGREKAQIYLPNEEEDVRSGIDLFWMESGLQIVVSIKSVQGNEIQVWGKTDSPTRPQTLETLKEFLHRLEKNKKEGFPLFEPLLVYVGRDVKGYAPTVLEWADEAIQKIKFQSCRPHKEDCHISISC